MKKKRSVTKSYAPFKAAKKKAVKKSPVINHPTVPAVVKTAKKGSVGAVASKRSTQEDEYSSDPPKQTLIQSQKTLTKPSSSDHSSESSLSALKLKPKVAENTVPHIQVRALAGTGKTTTLVEGMKVIKGMTAAITPSPQQAAVWDALKEGKNGTIRFNAFGKAIADELSRRLQGFGLDKLGCEASTFHSMGYKAVNSNLGYKKPNKYAVIDMVSDMLGQDFRDLKRDPKLLTLVNAVDKLVGLCKQNLSASDPESLDVLTSHYDVDVGDSKSTAYTLVPEVLEKCKDPKGNITFDDMVWLPVVLDLSINKADTLLVDESQDLNQMQQALAYKSGQRIVFVGDPNQAIFGFAGADSESMNRMHSYLDDTTVGCQVLPLTVTRRCGRAIVKEANLLVPELEAHESNPEGEVLQAAYDSKHPNYYGKDVQEGDMIICRCNAPLISQCFKFLKEGRKATIMGRDIGEGLIATVRRMKADTVPQLIGALSDWKAEEEAKENSKRMPSDIKLINISDKYHCLVAFSEGAQTIEDIVNKVQTIFTDDPHKPGIRLASIHKSKGLESQRVVILMPKYALCPHPMAELAWQREQENHLLYVARTRAISRLTYATEDPKPS